MSHTTVTLRDLRIADSRPVHSFGPDLVEQIWELTL